MVTWNDLYNKIMEYNIPIIECVNFYYMIHNNQQIKQLSKYDYEIIYKKIISEASQGSVDRYNSFLDKDGKLSKILLSIDIAEKHHNIVWSDLKEFIQSLSQDDINMAYNSCDRIIDKLSL